MLKNLQIKFTSRLAIFLLILIVVVLFWGITKSFYQQDEWHGLGDILVLGSRSIFLNIWNIPQLVLGEGRPASNAIVYFFYNNFRFNVFPIAFFAIVFHSLNTILVFLLAKRVLKQSLLLRSKKIFPSFFGAIFFAVSSVSTGVITWPASGIAALPATFLIILSLFSFFEFIQKGKGRLIIISFILLYISLFFKETAIPFFFLLPFSVFLFKRYSVRYFVKNFWSYLGFSLTIILFRIFQFKSIQTQQDLFLTGASKSFIPTLVIRAVMYPLTSFSLLWIPTGPIFSFAKQMTWLYYSFLPPDLYDLVAQTTVLDGIAVFLTLILLFVLFLIFKGSKQDVKRKVLFFAGFIVISFLPYIIISKTFSYLESRYYYIGTIGASVLLALVIDRLGELNNFFQKLLVFGLILLFLVHAKATGSEVARQALLGQERIKILKEIESIKPALGQKTVFYLTGDRSFYIGNGNNAPFQEGIGNTLLVWYIAYGKAPSDLLNLVKKYYLWEMDGEGYEVVDGKGYGYFWDIEKLKELVKKDKSEKFDFVGLYYDSKKQEIVDITKDVKFK